jgi:UDP-N-acetyl-D-mannosaminuronate dehydrogenase
VLVLGVAYRGDVHESAFTSAKRLQDALLEHGAAVYVDDPLFSDDEVSALGYRPFVSERSDEICAIILQADHRVYQEFDFSRYTNCQVVLDGRRAFRREWIESEGMRYIAIGDGQRDKQDRGSDKQPVAASTVQNGGDL